jgi:DNA-binding transcriptional LysR family regulator
MLTIFALMRNSVSFEDVLLVSAVAGTGNVRTAAHRISVHVATVYRRLKTLEALVGAPLFHRTSGGVLTPTPAALDITEAADSLQLRLLELNRQLAGNDARLRGELVVTTTDSLVPFVCDAIAHFQSLEPDVAVRFMVSGAHADMARNEADVAIRATTTPPETLVGQRVVPFDYVICALDPSSDPDHGYWIALDGALASIPAARWVADNIAPARVKLRVDSMTGAAAAAAAGMGNVLLPRYMASTESLSIAATPDPPLFSEVWILTHPDLRAAPRVRAFMAAAAPHLRRSLLPLSGG